MAHDPFGYLGDPLKNKEKLEAIPSIKQYKTQRIPNQQQAPLYNNE